MFLVQTALAAWIIRRLDNDRQSLTKELLQRQNPEQNVIKQTSKEYPPLPQSFPAMDDEFEAMLDARRRRQAREYLKEEIADDY